MRASYRGVMRLAFTRTRRCFVSASFSASGECCKQFSPIALARNRPTANEVVRTPRRIETVR
eukprot:scaffold2117_cov241-Pinguiococcus_pyrenoidosus.AAC.10